MDKLPPLDLPACEFTTRPFCFAGAQTRLDKLRLLNHLLFGPGPPPRHRQFAAIPPPDGFGLEISVSEGVLGCMSDSV